MDAHKPSDLGGRVDQRFFGVIGAAAYTDLSAKSIRRLLAAGKITGLRPIRGRVLIDRLQLDELILGADSNTRGGRGRTPKNGGGHTKQ